MRFNTFDIKVIYTSGTEELFEDVVYYKSIPGHLLIKLWWGGEQAADTSISQQAISEYHVIYKQKKGGESNE